MNIGHQGTHRPRVFTSNLYPSALQDNPTGERIRTPKRLFPIHTEILNMPSWISPAPELFFFSKVSAITLSPILWRDREGRVWFVPMGFQTDGASYPWPMNNFWNRWAINMRLPATLHDFRYCLYDYCIDWPDKRKDADRDFLRGMYSTKADYAFIKYLGVKLGGYVIYKHQSDEAMMDSWLDAVDNNREEEWVQAIIGNKAA